MNGMYAMKKDMKNDMQAMNDDLQQKKSFYEVEDVGTLTQELETFGNAVTVKLVNCDPAIPLEKRAFNIETLGVRMSDGVDASTSVNFVSVLVDSAYLVTEPDLQDLTANEPRKAFTEQIGASDQVQYIYLVSLEGTDNTTGISLKAVAIGQMP